MSAFCTRCRHGCRQAGGDIDCRHATWSGTAAASNIVRAWLLGQRGRDCSAFEEFAELTKERGS